MVATTIRCSAVKSCSKCWRLISWLITLVVGRLLTTRCVCKRRIALLASSDTFRAMFDGNYREKDAEVIPIPNYRFCVFEAMMRCIYTGAPSMQSASGCGSCQLAFHAWHLSFCRVP